MSLINFRNFVTPFSNKVGIGALVVITIIVAVARISGAHTNQNSGGDRESTQRSSNGEDEATMNAEIANFLQNQDVGENDRAGLRNGREGGSAPIEDPLLNDLLRRELEAKPKPNRDQNQNNNRGLSDIRRTLGLE